jgi:phosphopantetheine adenylyltransferase
MRTKRSFSPEERLSILQESQREGQKVTCRKYCTITIYWMEEEAFIKKGLREFLQKEFILKFKRV